MRRGTVSQFFLRAPILRLSLIGGLIFIQASSSVTAQDQIPGVPQEGPDSQITPQVNVTGRILQNTTMRTNPSFKTVSCASSECIAQAAIFSPPNISVNCPGASRTTCTYKITCCAQFIGTSLGDNQLYQFLIDGVTPSPGPTDAAGFVTVEFPTDGQLNKYCESVVDTGNAPGPHSIATRFGINDQTGDGASQSIGFAECNIQVFKP